MARVFFALGFLSGLSGASERWLIRLSLMKVGGLLGNPLVYNALITLHAVTMIFFMVIPVLVGGFGNFLLPSLYGAPDTAFPRVNLLSVTLLPGALYFLGLRALLDLGPGVSWVIYPPLAR